jgi:N-acetylglucosamine kinase-like BadF-type ATPase
MARIVLGMDIGGTKSHAVLADESGRILGEGYGGAGNINFIPLQMAEESFTEAITTARKKAGIKKLATEFAVIGIEPQPEPLFPCLKRVAAPKKIIRKQEGECSMVGGLAEKVGISLIAGTGSVGWGRNAAGEVHETSCWGPIGDEGSAYWLAEHGLNAAFCAEDKRGPYTRMHEKVCERLGGVSNIRENITLLYTSQDFRKEVSQYSKIVMDLATADPPDKVMRDIVHEGAELLAHILAVCAEALHMHTGPYKVAATGSLVTKVPYYFNQVQTRLQKRHAGAQMVLPRFSPGVGAVLIALDMIGVEWTEELLANMDATAEREA